MSAEDLMTGIDYPRFVHAMARYFKRMEASHGAAWSAGRSAAALWEQLLAGSTDADLAELDGLMRVGSGDTCSAWQEMTLLYPAWRSEAGSPRQTP
ncbi:hypothetical protein KDL01_33700 [Actinospica durhamensis]|uniref:Uncharacterized protein n=1 Tax=Actinospica durhamensis TaxID=1508375 RepID=A0A941EVZ2_9ACTN|nr:hypothetical protein [Actinospica durhamensis]MBR7838276.1 hypothetical protein [Actinospica durhamensis]